MPLAFTFPLALVARRVPRIPLARATIASALSLVGCGDNMRDNTTTTLAPPTLVVFEAQQPDQRAARANSRRPREFAKFAATVSRHLPPAVRKSSSAMREMSAFLQARCVGTARARTIAMARTQIEPIETMLLATVTGGMQFDPGLLGTMSQLARKKRSTRSADMQQIVRTLGTAMSSLTTSMAQSKQQSSQAMMQMLPQMMGR